MTFATEMDSRRPLTKRGLEPLTAAGCIAIGSVALMGLHAILRPQYHDISFGMAVMAIGLFVAYAIGYIIWLIIKDVVARLRKRGYLPPSSGTGGRSPDAPVPAPLKPRPLNSLSAAAPLEDELQAAHKEINAVAGPRRSDE